MPAVKILVIDNYDSFVYNLVQYLAQIGPRSMSGGTTTRASTIRTSRTDLTEFCSPGPGTPEEAGVCVEVVRTRAGRLPIFGVCLGLQAIGVAYGGVVDRAPELLHGKTSLIQHHGAVSPAAVTVHRDPLMSLAIEPETLPVELEVTATTRSGVIMAVRHRGLPVEAVQFHPESVLTEWGYQMLANWLAICGDAEACACAAAWPC